MDRPCREASKVANYRQYHLSGDLDEVVQGKVGETVVRLEQAFETLTMSSEEAQQNIELAAKVKEQKEKSQKLQLQVENTKLRNELEMEKLQQEQWEAALQQLQQAKENMMEEHRQNMD